MSEFSISSSDSVTAEEALSLYESVGWTTYTRDPDVLMRAIRGSSFLVTARGPERELWGLARAISDDVTICYLQDILVRPDIQRAGIGRALLEHVKAKYQHVRQTVLITDDEPAQRVFYESLGFTEGGDNQPEPIRAFMLFR